MPYRSNYCAACVDGDDEESDAPLGAYDAGCRRLTSCESAHSDHRTLHRPPLGQRVERDGRCRDCVHSGIVAGTCFLRTALQERCGRNWTDQECHF